MFSLGGVLVEFVVAFCCLFVLLDLVDASRLVYLFCGVCGLYLLDALFAAVSGYLVWCLAFGLCCFAVAGDCWWETVCARLVCWFAWWVFGGVVFCLLLFGCVLQLC